MSDLFVSHRIMGSRNLTRRVSKVVSNTYGLEQCQSLLETLKTLLDLFPIGTDPDWTASVLDQAGSISEKYRVLPKWSRALASIPD